MPNLADLLTHSAAERPDSVAVKLDDAELSYAALDEAAARAAGLVRAKGVHPGDRVGIMLPNVTYFPICYYGALRAGAAVVPVNSLLKEREVAFHLGDSEAKVLLAWHEFADAAQAGAEQTDTDCVLVEPGEFEALLDRCQPVPEVAERRPDDTAVILYTSGTTGTPKGANRSQPKSMDPIAALLDRIPLKAREVNVDLQQPESLCVDPIRIDKGDKVTLTLEFAGRRR